MGKRRCIDLLKRHPLARALRVDKLTLAALEATLQAYVDGTALQEIPVLSMLAQTPEELRQRAESLCRRMGEIGVTAKVVSTENPVGGGAALLRRGCRPKGQRRRTGSTAAAAASPHHRPHRP